MDRRSFLSLLGIGATASVVGIKVARPAPVASPAAPIIGELRQVFSHWAPGTTMANHPGHTHTLTGADPNHYHSISAYPCSKTVIWNGTEWVDGFEGVAQLHNGPKV